MVSDRWELLVQKLSKRLDDGGFCACVCVLHNHRSAGCLCVALCPQLPRDNIQFVRKPTDFASARFSTSSSAVHSRILCNASFSLILSLSLFLSIPPSSLCLTSFSIFFYFTPVVVSFSSSVKSVLRNKLRVPTQHSVIPVFRHFLLFPSRYFGRFERNSKVPSIVVCVCVCVCVCVGRNVLKACRLRFAVFLNCMLPRVESFGFIVGYG